MIKVKQLFKMLFLLMTITSLSACTKEDSGEGGGGGESGGGGSGGGGASGGW